MFKDFPTAVGITHNMEKSIVVRRQGVEPFSVSQRINDRPRYPLSSRTKGENKCKILE